MSQPTVTTTPVSAARPKYFNVLLNGKAVCEIRYPATNPHLRDKSLQEIAEMQVKRILES